MRNPFKKTPSWSGGLKGRQLDTFISLCRQAVLKRWPDTPLEDFETTGDIKVLGRFSLHMDNLAGRFFREHESNWNEMIEGHFEAIEEQIEKADDGMSFEGIKDRLTGVLLCPGTFSEKGTHDLGLVPMVQSLLALDEAGSVRYIPYETRNEWSITDDDLVALVLENNWRRLPANWARGEVRGHPMTILSNDSFYTTSSILFHHRFPFPETAAGYVVSIPNGATAIYYQVVSGQFEAMLETARSVHDKMFEGSGRPVSPVLHWVWEGMIRTLRDIPGGYLLPAQLMRAVKPELSGKINFKTIREPIIEPERLSTDAS